MPLFKRKPDEIEAFKMTADRFENNSEWPEWLNRAWNKEPDELFAFYKNDKGYFIMDFKQKVQVNENDYIVLGDNKELTVISFEVIEALYNPA